MEESTDAQHPASAEEPSEPEVRTSLDGGVAHIRVTGELAETARRPVVRAMTDLLLSTPDLRRVDLELRDVTFMNSAGMAVLVQVQRMAAPRGVEIVLVEPASVVVRPLQLSGLWRRFPVRESGGGRERPATEAAGEPGASPGGRPAGERPGGPGAGG